MGTSMCSTPVFKPLHAPAKNGLAAHSAAGVARIRDAQPKSAMKRSSIVPSHPAYTAADMSMTFIAAKVATPSLTRISRSGRASLPTGRGR